MKVLLGADLIDGTGGPVLKDSAILIDGDRIKEAGPRAAVTLPQGTEEIDLRYKDIVAKLHRPDYTEIVDHIDHMVKVAGIDHVGLGSDFDGCRLPVGMEDCTKVPKITEELIRRGYADGDIKKILGENVLRVMEAAIGE